MRRVHGASVTLRFVADVPGVVDGSRRGRELPRPAHGPVTPGGAGAAGQRLAPRSEPVVSEPFSSASRMQTISRSPSSQVSALGTSVEK